MSRFANLLLAVVPPPKQSKRHTRWWRWTTTVLIVALLPLRRVSVPTSGLVRYRVSLVSREQQRPQIGACLFNLTRHGDNTRSVLCSLHSLSVSLSLFVLVIEFLQHSRSKAKPVQQNTASSRFGSSERTRYYRNETRQ